MKKNANKIKGKAKQPKPRIGVWFTKSEESVKNKKKVKMKDIDKLLDWKDD
jgi:hypothetical protein